MFFNNSFSRPFRVRSTLETDPDKDLGVLCGVPVVRGTNGLCMRALSKITSCSCEYFPFRFVSACFIIIAFGRILITFF